MSRDGYFEVFQRVPRLQDNESRLYFDSYITWKCIQSPLEKYQLSQQAHNVETTSFQS